MAIDSVTGCLPGIPSGDDELLLDGCHCCGICVLAGGDSEPMFSIRAANCLLRDRAVLRAIRIRAVPEL